jgi:hypothetical protein
MNFTAALITSGLEELSLSETRRSNIRFEVFTAVTVKERMAGA